MDILMVASEMVPFAKTGGLADVVGQLPKELENLGHHLGIVLPYYRMVKEGGFETEHVNPEFVTTLSDKAVQGEILRASLAEHITVWLIKNDHYYDRDGLYGSEKGDYEDNAERFTFFCRATLELIKTMGLKPDIIHCHDWQAGLIPVYLKTLLKRDPSFATVRTVFTIHNLAYQGVFPKADMPLTGLPWEAFTPEGIEFYGKLNLLKGGIVYADAVTTVSRTYSQEIQTKEFGCGLEGVVQSRKEDLYGILNGADYTEWDPEKDRFIRKNYDKTTYLSGKKDCKRSLLEEFGLELEEDAPLFGLVSRLAHQKGIDLVAEAADEISRCGGLVILGKGDEKYERLALELRDKYHGKVGVRVAFDEPLAHEITAGSDFFLIPSRYEPCGLNAIYSLKYGTIPIVRATGGLDDIIIPFDPESGSGNGFKFHNLSKEAILSAIREATRVYEEKDPQKRLLQSAMKCDYSWEKPAREYEKLYLKALNEDRRL